MSVLKNKRAVCVKHLLLPVHQETVCGVPERLADADVDNLELVLNLVGSLN